MTKYKISPNLYNARTQAIWELDKLVAYIIKLDPELRTDEATAIAGYVLSNLPDLFTQNPEIINRLQEVSATVKRNRPKSESN